MVKVSSKDIIKIANLAMIEIDQQKQQDFCNQINNVLDWVDKLNEVDTTNVIPLSTVCQHSLALNEDLVNDGNITDDILKNANNPKYGYFSVPKVIE